MLVRVLAYNIKDGGLGRETYILEVLAAARPDVIVLEEVYDATPIQHWADALNMTLVRARGNTRRHLALLSRFPVVANTSFHPNPPIHTTLLAAVLRLNQQKSLTVFGVHLLAGPFIAMELWRVWELAAILPRLPASDSPALIVGDFNAIAPGDPVHARAWPALLRAMLALQAGHVFRAAMQRVLTAGLVDCFRALHRADPGFTLPATAPNARLDYAFANAAAIINLRACRVVQEPAVVQLASDHLPLMVEFDL